MLVLKPSKRHGVGVFTTAAIPKGRVPPLFSARDWRIARRALAGAAARYCVQRKRGYYVPRNVHRMCVGWYLNDSLRPNIACNTWRATRRIRAGEELTINYDVLEGRSLIQREANDVR